MKKNNGFTINIIQLRQAVGYLMEDSKWCSSEFFNSNANSILEYAFPRSKKSLVAFGTDAMRKVTDGEVGANYFHLFRLPIAHEEAIHNTLIDLSLNELNSRADALSRLRESAKGLSANKVSGPKNIGCADALGQDILEIFAAEYLTAFENDYEVYPYLN